MYRAKYRKNVHTVYYIFLFTKKNMKTICHMVFRDGLCLSQPQTVLCDCLNFWPCVHHSYLYIHKNTRVGQRWSGGLTWKQITPHQIWTALNVFIDAPPIAPPKPCWCRNVYADYETTNPGRGTKNIQFTQDEISNSSRAQACSHCCCFHQNRAWSVQPSRKENISLV